MVKTIMPLLLAAMTLAPAWPAQPAPPAPHPVTQTYFGVRVTDPYRYFENLKSPVVQRFFKEQNAYTDAILARLGPGRQQIFKRIHTLDNAGVSVGGINRVGGLYFFEEQKPGESTSRLYVRPAAGGTPRLLVNPDTFAKPGHHDTMDFFVPSYDGKYVAFGVAPGGSEDDVTRVVRVADAKVLSDAITRTRFGVTGWDLNSKSFYYNRLPVVPPNAPPTEQQVRPIVYRHVVGTPIQNDRRIFGIGVNPGISMTPTDTASVGTTPGSKYALAVVGHGVRNELTIYAEPVADLERNRAAWQKVVDVEDDVTDAEVDGNLLFLITHKGAPNYKIVAIDMSRPDFANARVVVPESRRTIVRNVAVAHDGIYVLVRNGGLSEMSRLTVGPDGTPATNSPVRLPYEGNIEGLTTDPRVDGATFGLTGWTTTLLYFQTTPELAVGNTHLKPPFPIDTSAYTSVEAQARSQDGTMVPISIIYHKGAARDGSHPAYLEGYGAYGMTITPYLDATRLVWLEHDGVYAVCHPRGGGWFGEAWHRAGMIGTKQHTVQDFIACAQYLIDQHYTARNRLAGEGTSAGGITIGDAIVQRPALFAAALDVDGVTDALRSEFEPNGPSNIPEFGSVQTQAGFRALYAMDAYLHIKDGTPYPAVLINTGMNDPRVSPAEAAKFAARLQAATSSRKPILLRVSYDEGHGLLGASREQGEALLADEYSFLLWQLGDPAFSSIPRLLPKR